MTDRLQEYRARVVGTNIDPRSLLSTDYFNTFNSVVMLYDMLPEMPDLLEEVDQWQYLDYVGHFRASGLDFADLAIEAYAHAPREWRDPFERKIEGMRIFVEETARTLHRLHDAGEVATFGNYARAVAALFRGMMDEGGAIVHGNNETLTQTSIDILF